MLRAEPRACVREVEVTHRGQGSGSTQLHTRVRHLRHDVCCAVLCVMCYVFHQFRVVCCSVCYVFHQCRGVCCAVSYVFHQCRGVCRVFRVP